MKSASGFVVPQQNVFLIWFSTKFQQVSAKRNRKTASVNDKNSHESNQSADPKKALGTRILWSVCRVLGLQDTLHDIYSKNQVQNEARSVYLSPHVFTGYTHKMPSPYAHNLARKALFNSFENIRLKFKPKVRKFKSPNIKRRSKVLHEMLINAPGACPNSN